MKYLIVILVLIFPSCKFNDNVQDLPVHGFVGQRTAIGAEIQIGRHAIGAAITHELKPAAVLEEGEPPYQYPLNEK